MIGGQLLCKPDDLNMHHRHDGVLSNARLPYPGFLLEVARERSRQLTLSQSRPVIAVDWLTLVILAQVPEVGHSLLPLMIQASNQQLKVGRHQLKAHLRQHVADGFVSAVRSYSLLYSLRCKDDFWRIFVSHLHLA